MCCNSCVIHKQLVLEELYLKTEEYLKFYFFKFHNSHTDLKFMKKFKRSGDVNVDPVNEEASFTLS